MAANAVRRSILWTLADLAAVLVLAAVFARRLTRPIAGVAALARKVASGDLRVEALAVRSRDEVGALVQDFNQMTASLQSLLGKTVVSAQQVAAAAGQLMEASNQVAQVSGQVAEGITSVAAGASQQAETTAATHTVVQQVQNAIQQMASSATQTTNDVATTVSTLN